MHRAPSTWTEKEKWQLKVDYAVICVLEERDPGVRWQTVFVASDGNTYVLSRTLLFLLKRGRKGRKSNMS